MPILRFSGEGEVFYSQPRIGASKKTFYIWKFATMKKTSPNIGSGMITIKNDPRVLPFGKLLRKTKINELPQLVNILIGQMSVIGPRPQTERCFEAFNELVKSKIVNVRPGLSGIGSIIFRNEEQFLSQAEDATKTYDEVIAPYKGSCEIWFIDRRGIRLYFEMIFFTIWHIFIPGSKIIWSYYSDLPRLPENLFNMID